MKISVKANLKRRVVLASAMGASVTAVSLSKGNPVIKGNQKSIRLISGGGVAGDDHCGEKVQHIYSKKVNPDQPNLRQVHLIHSELHDELKTAGFNVGPGQMGENVTTRGVDLLSLPLGTRLHIGSGAILEVTGIRNACSKLNIIQKGLLKAVQYPDGQGNMVRKCGIMSIVVRGDEVHPGDAIQVELPPYPHMPLPALS
ncbi:hypothetical protein R1sor_014480 [Riccia sorocarpa]|uniref:MOSC domain-containing protein n=1 Tax=Riccia sorocarpa TaxID=122646 RepID=A0ABD3HBE2_9MARC